MQLRTWARPANATFLVVAWLLMAPQYGSAQEAVRPALSPAPPTQESHISTTELKKLPLEQLLDGATLKAKWRVTDWWQIEGNLSALHVNLHRSADSADPTNGDNEWNDPDYFGSLTAIRKIAGEQNHHS